MKDVSTKPTSVFKLKEAQLKQNFWRNNECKTIKLQCKFIIMLTEWWIYIIVARKSVIKSKPSSGHKLTCSNLNCAQWNCDERGLCPEWSVLVRLRNKRDARWCAFSNFWKKLSLLLKKKKGKVFVIFVCAGS